MDSEPVREGRGFIGDDDVGQEIEDEGWELEGIRRRSQDRSSHLCEWTSGRRLHTLGGGGHVHEDNKMEADLVPNHYLSQAVREAGAAA